MQGTPGRVVTAVKNSLVDTTRPGPRRAVAAAGGATVAVWGITWMSQVISTHFAAKVEQVDDEHLPKFITCMPPVSVRCFQVNANANC